jgi:NDP-4-keto-2,6-dideoxyhexose 3-C-methyltransferase
VCGNTRLELVLDLGTQFLTGVFPKTIDESITSGPLQLVKCCGELSCGLVQLAHSYALAEMYGDNYGYRSGLNASMVTHLQSKVERIKTLVDFAPGDVAIDIGSNDATTLRAYPDGLTLIGVDPTGNKFQKFYPAHIELVADFFPSPALANLLAGRKAKVVTSFSMFYDLEDPLTFMAQVRDVLADDGIWVFEQSYMPAMLRTNSFDTVCHEHLEFYGLSQIKWMADKVGLQIIDCEFNAVNGGSFSVTVRKATNSAVPDAIARILHEEKIAGLETLQPYLEFADRAASARDDINRFVDNARAQSKRISALGASTKGNVLLQYCGLNADRLNFVGEVNSEKFGCVTPGSWIPIIPQDELLVNAPDYLLVLPWHFRSFFVGAPAFAGRELLFPLPALELVG